MRYINTKTGAIIDSPCAISGENWQMVEEPVAIPAEVAAKEVMEPDLEEVIEENSEVITLSEMTVANLKKFAEENEIDLGKATKKDDIIKVIMESDAVEVE